MAQFVRGVTRQNGLPVRIRVRILPHSLCATVFSQQPRPSTMDPKSSKRQNRQENALTLLNVAIEALNLAKEVSSVTPAKAVFGSVSVLLTMIKVRLLPSSSNESQTHI